MATLKVSKTIVSIGDKIQLSFVVTDEERGLIKNSSLEYTLKMQTGIIVPIEKDKNIDDIVEFTLESKHFDNELSFNIIVNYTMNNNTRRSEIVNTRVYLIDMSTPTIIPYVTVNGIESPMLQESNNMGEAMRVNSLTLDAKIDSYPTSMKSVPVLETKTWTVASRSVTASKDNKVDLQGYIRPYNFMINMAKFMVSAPGYKTRSVSSNTYYRLIFDFQTVYDTVKIIRTPSKENIEWTDSQNEFNIDYTLDFSDFPIFWRKGINETHADTKLYSLASNIDGERYTSSTRNHLYTHISANPFVGIKEWTEDYYVYIRIYDGTHWGDFRRNGVPVSRKIDKSTIGLINAAKLRLTPLEHSGPAGSTVDITASLLDTNIRPDFPADMFTAGEFSWKYDDGAYVKGTAVHKATLNGVKNVLASYKYVNNDLFTKHQILIADAPTVLTATGLPVINATVKLSENEVHIPWNSQKQITATVEGAPFGSQISYTWFSKPGYPVQQGNVYNVKTDEISRHDVVCQVTIVHADYQTAKIESLPCDMNIEKIKVVPVGEIVLSHTQLLPNVEMNAKLVHNHNREIPESAIDVKWYLDNVEIGNTIQVYFEFETVGVKQLKVVYKINSDHYTSDEITLNKTLNVENGIQNEEVTIITRSIIPLGVSLHPQIIVSNVAPGTVITYEWKINDVVDASTDNFVDFTPTEVGLVSFECIATLKHPSYEDTIRATMFNVMVADSVVDIEPKYPPHYMEHINTAFGYGSWWSLDEIQSDPTGWKINGNLKYQDELNTYRYSIEQYENLLTQESRNGKIFDKKKLESGVIY